MARADNQVGRCREVGMELRSFESIMAALAAHDVRHLRLLVDEGGPR
jgi:hypothetical protein